MAARPRHESPIAGALRLAVGATMCAVAAVVWLFLSPHSPISRRGLEATAEELALGRRVLDRFCLSCHSLDDPKWHPLRPALRGDRWATFEAAYQSVGQLDQINSSMTLEFQGTEAERRALAKVLARLAAGER